MGNRGANILPDTKIIVYTMRKLILFAIIMLALSGIFNKVNAQPYYKPIGPATAQPNWYVWSNVGLKVDDSLWLTEYAVRLLY